ncbi:MAG: PKD domain-containing protein [Chitinophagaceae bacterium]
MLNELKKACHFHLGSSAHALPFIISVIIIFFITSTSFAQLCPRNIDFETGTFDGWTCYTGFTAAVGGQNQINITPSSGPIPNRHTMFSNNGAAEVDPYGGFSVNCPNGSGHSVRLGNNSGGGEAEGMSYEFKIPANQDDYTLVYNYAVVFQEPNHQSYEQPRMEIEVMNVTDNTVINCASFDFIPYGTALPGFEKAPSFPGDSIPVWYKDWSAVSVNLAGNAGKTIRLFFKTADCTFRRHFGYAYIDVNSECSGTLVGATYCKTDTAINVYAPFGYQSYTWYDQQLTTVLGTNQILKLKPPPTPGTVLAVKVTPYSGYGCPQTFFTKFSDTLNMKANAGKDTNSCNNALVPIGVLPKPGFRYRWSPVAGLSNPDASNPFASPVVNTVYTLTTIHDGGGCQDADEVIVTADIVDNSIQRTGAATFCLGNGDPPILRVHPTDSIQWFRDNFSIRGANSPDFTVMRTGSYHALLMSKKGCTIKTTPEAMNVASIPDAAFAAATSPEQCLVGNKFIFTNNSVNAVGEMSYAWNTGDGMMASTKDLTYSYSRPGTYHLSLISTSNIICIDTANITIVIHPNAVADFSVSPVCIDVPVKLLNSTADTLGSKINYVWNLGNGQVFNSRMPPPSSYTKAGIYTVSLSVNTDQCPTPYNTLQRSLVVDKPLVGLNYPVKYAVVDLPQSLFARKFGTEIAWSPGVNLDNPSSYMPVFKGSRNQTYNISITTSTGCVTTDVQEVRIVNKIELYVPNAFTPNGDGRNDVLRPILFGIKEVRYFKVYNRGGQMLYSQNSELPGWDGTFNGATQSAQTVIWMAEGLGVDGKTYFRKGTAELIR